MHLGGDEVLTSCFNENPNLIPFMDSLGLDTYQDLIVYWMGNAREILTSINAEKTAMYWSNEDTFYQRYQDGDILVYWGESANIGVMLDTYPMQ